MSESAEQVSDGHHPLCLNHSARCQLRQVYDVVVINNNDAAAKCRKPFSLLETENTEISKGTQKMSIPSSPKCRDGILNRHAIPFLCSFTDGLDLRWRSDHLG